MTRKTTNTVIKNAVLYLFAFNSPDGQHSQLDGSNASVIQRITQEWDENTVTWNNQPATTEVNQVNVPASSAPDQNYEINVTQLIQDIIYDPENGHGLMLKLETESYYRSLIFASSDNPDTSLHPKLVIEF